MKEIALQAGVSLATVDRVLHERPGVRLATRHRVQQACAELERQRQQVGRKGRRFLIDLVMAAPGRFSSMVLQALLCAMQQAQPAVFRVRDHLADTWSTPELVQRLDAIGRQGSHGVLLKAPDVPEVAAAVARLQARGIPVITLVTDLENSSRVAYVGLDNAGAGQTAAYLMRQWMGSGARDVLVSSSGAFFQGEKERISAFTQEMRRWRPDCTVHVQHDGKGLLESTLQAVFRLLRQRPRVSAVYSVGGANQAVVEAFDRAHRPCVVFIGHDLDDENLRLLRAGRISAVVHHDLLRDLHNACLLFMRAHGVSTTPLPATLSRPEVITPFNIPSL